MQFIVLTLILPTPKAISLCHQYIEPGQPDHLENFILISLKLIMNSAKNVGRIISFRKFDMIRVLTVTHFTNFMDLLKFLAYTEPIQCLNNVNKIV